MPVLLRWFLRLGPTNPIAVRLVSNGSRRSRHHYIRLAYLGTLIVVLLAALLTKTSGQGGSLSYTQLAAAGATSFTWIAYLQIALICVLAPVFMAGAIAQEADPQTWDILLATPLGAGEIVLGNLFGRLFFILALIFSSLPLFAVTQFFGGVPGSSIFASYLIAACAALLVGAAAIALSVSRLVGRRAVFTFYVAVVSYVAVTIGVDRLITTGGVTLMTAINPFLALQALLDPTSYARATPGSLPGVRGFLLESPVTAWCVLSSGLSAALMAVSVATVRLGGIAGLGGMGGRGGIPWYRRMLGLGAAGAEHRPPRAVWHNPISWREAAARNATLSRILMRYAFILLGIALGPVLVFLFHSGQFSLLNFRTALLYTVMGELAVVGLVAINMAATSVSREREDGTLDLILTTPLTPGHYLTGKLQGIVAYLLPMLVVPVTTLLIAGVYVGFDGFGRGGVSIPGIAAAPGVTPPTYPAVLPEAGILVALVAVPFSAFCVIVGMQWSLRSKGTITSVMATVGVIAAVAGLVGLCAWRAGSDVPSVGPVAAALSPASTVFASIFPEEGLAKTAATDLGAARVGLAVGAVISAVLHVVVMLSLRASMTRGFDMTVRRLAGVK